MEKVQKTYKYKLPSLPIIKWINAFIYSKAFVVLIAILTVISNAFAMDLYLFCIVTAFAVYISIFGKDYLPYLPMLCFCYIASSIENNPGKNANSVLFPQNSGYLLFYLVAIILSCMVLRFILDPEIGFKNIFKQKRKLSVSIIVLGITYLVSGIFSKGYFSFAVKNYVIAGLQFAVMFVPYFILSFTVKWDSVAKDYLAFVGVMLGITVCAELINVYIAHDIASKNILTWKHYIYTGWGNCNNVGAFISMMIPFAFYYVCKSKISVAWLLVADFMFLMAIFTLSRTSIIAGIGVMLVGSLIAIIVGNKTTKLMTVFNLLFALLLTWAFGWSQFKTLYVTFEGVFKSDPRVELYKIGFKTFLDFPVFGNGFFSLSMNPPDVSFEWSSESSFTSFFPARWHNTVIQLIATGGIVSLIAYLFHRLKTITLLFKKPSLETMFTFFSIAVLLAMSMLDCHLFNLGPVLFYSVALAFVEFRIPHFTEKVKLKEFSYDLNENCLLK